jgi:hypothetical protein
MFAASFSGVLMQFVPGYESILAGTAVGRSITGLLLACAAMLLQYACATVVAYVGVRLLVRYLDHQPPAMLKLRPTKTGMIWFAAMIGVAMVIFLIAGGITILFDVAGEPLAQHGDQWWATLIIVLGMAFLLQGIPEEFIWRGWLLPSLGAKTSMRWAVGFSVVVFGSLHLVSRGGQSNALEHVIYLAMPLGFAYAAAMARLVANSTWAAVGVHGGFHTAMVFANVLPINNSPILWALIGALWFAVGLAIRAWRRPFAPAQSDPQESVPA